VIAALFVSATGCYANLAHATPVEFRDALIAIAESARSREE
jgi:hypothetical protein